jgi:hypothetical protein
LILGAIGGAIGLSLAELINKGLIAKIGYSREGSVLNLIGTMLARGLAWSVLGLAVGLSEGLAARSLGKFSYGAIGGAIGGFVGGALFGLLYTLAVRRESTTLFWGAAGLVILGACIGSLSALVQGVFQPASFKVPRGWQEGREYPLDKTDTLLGRDEHADVALFRDMKVEKRHAIIQREGPRYVLLNNEAPPAWTRVNGDPVPTYRDLRDGDRIQLGNVVLRFQLHSAKVRQR